MDEDFLYEDEELPPVAASVLVYVRKIGPTVFREIDEREPHREGDEIAVDVHAAWPGNALPAHDLTVVYTSTTKIDDLPDFMCGGLEDDTDLEMDGWRYGDDIDD